jgi:hypothetical protein
MSTIKVNTIQNTSGVEVYTAKAWVRFNGPNITVYGSGNVSSITDNGVGIYTTNFSSNLASSNYAVNATSGPSNVRIPAIQTHTTSSSQCEWTNHSVAYYDVSSADMSYTL